MSLNLLHTREGLGLTQLDMSNKIGVSLRTYQRYEAKPHEVPVKKQNLIMSIFDIKNNYTAPNASETPEPIHNKNGNTFTELPNGKFLINAPLVPVKAHASYVMECCDAEFISGFDSIPFVVDHVGRGNYMSFEIKGDSMNDGTIESIPYNSIVLGREVQKHHWSSKLSFNKFPYWVIVHKDTILCKQIVSHGIERGVIKCHSLNNSPEFQDFEIELNDVHQLFNIIKKQI